jgi:hypothetical protein
MPREMQSSRFEKSNYGLSKTLDTSGEKPNTPWGEESPLYLDKKICGGRGRHLGIKLWASQTF